MKKIVFLLLVMLTLLTGCTAEVNVKISEGNISEDIVVYDKKSIVYPNHDDKISEEVEFQMEQFERGPTEMYYKMDKTQFDDNVGKTYVGTFDFNDWLNNSIIKKCYNKFDINNNSYSYSFKTSKKYVCGQVYGVKNVVFKITTDYEVIDNNADKIEGNTYIWNISDDNYQDEEIIFKISKTNYKPSLNVDKKYDIITKYVLISLPIIVFIGGIVIYIKVKNSNK